MNKIDHKNLLLLGITLFSMFFGAGNLIFPPFLGFEAGTNTLSAFVGFVITAVVFPVLGVVAAARVGGIDKLCEKIHPLFGRIFTLIIYICIGPLLAIPRTAGTSYAMFGFVTERAGDGSIFGLSVQLVLSIGFSALFFLAAGLAFGGLFRGRTGDFRGEDFVDLRVLGAHQLLRPAAGTAGHQLVVLIVNVGAADENHQALDAALLGGNIYHLPAAILAVEGIAGENGSVKFVGMIVAVT